MKCKRNQSRIKLFLYIRGFILSYDVIHSILSKKNNVLHSLVTNYFCDHCGTTTRTSFQTMLFLVTMLKGNDLFYFVTITFCTLFEEVYHQRAIGSNLLGNHDSFCFIYIKSCARREQLKKINKLRRKFCCDIKNNLILTL